MPISTPITGFDPDNLQGATVRPPAIQKAAYTIDYSTPYPASYPFRHTLVTGTNTNSGKTRDNHVHRFGWNLTESGVRDDQNHASVFMSFEEHFHPSSLTTPYIEWHVEGQDASGTAFRPFSFAGEFDDIANTLSTSVQSNKFTITTTDGQTERLKLDYVSNGFGIAIPGAGNTFVLNGGEAWNSSNLGGIYIRPRSAGNRDVMWRFGGGSGEIFQMGHVNTNVDSFMIGPRGTGGRDDAFNITNCSGDNHAAFGFGVDPTTSATSGDVYFLDGAQIRISGTTTCLTIGTVSDKLGFFGKAPVVQPSAADLAGVIAALKAVGILSV